MTVPGQFDEKDRAQLHVELNHIAKHWWFLPDWAMWLGVVIAVCSLFFVESVVARLVGTFASLYWASQVAYRLGVYFGFTEGFRQGHEQGVQRANGPPAPPPP